ncbi:ribosomal RNA small subunit methyltransferase A [Candidatus Falkowbacteria bacterium RIFOXYB2_FULL_38_15]|uniref:Ribosomal RNA small subunit methyltransferase A n=1 Tax=Candidatus Falkowbacteria bacterium RIFOXYA2_FULL_38_12 TaxID=1797993 RepID=A0A1F5S2A6_9BACT|nr:MAG: ribosomal RNA small subunit methyltransferase A [Candidatus Falkowbacteria bacterium RIFOXYA2_FULL_38_12]OGF32670.1 MAG: ribosomal RNA small subunit methyltransferase A [Candidatus Falkowbacteria bacterium RIFOXYB2_FULL_38_15]OGF42074.1 MAG: ribosomal RNA small subunit methyltransferase A [Candidatus Falkowbacteria bacterium RIFOXYD2_FULL_39_16]
MDLTSSETIKEFLRKNNISPSRDRGQNFLIDKNVLEKIVETADLKKNDIVLEIGAGFGTLTERLVQKAGKVITVESDRGILPILRRNLENYKNVEIIEKDVLQIPSNLLPVISYSYKIVANLPYQITSIVLRKFLESEPRPSEMVVMVQKEVAERICALPLLCNATARRAGEMSILAISVQFFGEPEIIEIVPRSSFYPAPEVDSAILKISNIKKQTEKNIKKIAPKDFFRVVKVGFSARRKQLHNNLTNGLHLKSEEVKNILLDLGLDIQVRAQDLSVDDWINLGNKLK